MTITCGDRVQETTNTTGLGSALSLLGATTQCQSFSAGIGTGNQCTYTVLDGDGVHWFTAIGTYSSGTLTRDTLLNGSNGPGTDVSLSATTPHTVFSNLLSISSNVIGKYTTILGDTGYTFSNIPQCFTDLELTMMGRLAGASNVNPTITINGLSTAIYSQQRMYVQTSTFGADQGLAGTNFGSGATWVGTGFGANATSFNRLRFFNYTNTTFTKVAEFWARQPNTTNTDNAFTIEGVIQIDTTSAITSLTISGAGQAFLTGSVFVLRGI